MIRPDVHVCMNCKNARPDGADALCKRCRRDLRREQRRAQQKQAPGRRR